MSQDTPQTIHLEDWVFQFDMSFDILFNLLYLLGKLNFRTCRPYEHNMCVKGVNGIIELDIQLIYLRFEANFADFEASIADYTDHIEKEFELNFDQ